MQQILGGIADTTAQTLTSIRYNAARRHHDPNRNGEPSVEVHELDKKVPWPSGEIISDNRNLPPPFDFERLTRFMSFGFLLAPLQFKWFGYLQYVFPITKTGGTLAALKRVAFDQTIAAPIGKKSHLKGLSTD